jgi:hypothetical protein
MKSQIGIIYSAPMILARKAGRKSQTRRLVPIAKVHEPDFGKPILDNGWIDTSYMNKACGNVPCLKIPFDGNGNEDMRTTHRHFPRWEPNDLLWTRETYTVTAWKRLSNKFRGLVRLTGFYNADGQKFDQCLTVPESKKFARRKRKIGKIPAIFMFRSLSRFTDEVTKVWAERVQKITEKDAIAEGVTPTGRRKTHKWKNGKDISHQREYAFLWSRLHGHDSLKQNPWVWVLEFKPAPQPQKRTKRWLDRRFGARR